MKKFLNTIILSVLVFTSMALPIKATDGETTKLKLKVENVEEDYEIYMLLPKKYIMYAIQHDGLDIEYDGANTLKHNTIPSIVVDVNNVQDETYIEDRIEYVQIKLDNLGDNEYLFEIIPEYTDMDMKYRVKSASKDDILIIENFQIENNKCEIEYNYKENTLKTERKSNVKIKFNLKWWQVVLIVAIVLILVYFLNRRNNR